MAFLVVTLQGPTRADALPTAIATNHEIRCVLVMSGVSSASIHDTVSGKLDSWHDIHSP